MKKSTMLAGLLGVVMASAGVGARAAATMDGAMDGTWSINGDVAGNPVVTTCVLTVVESKVGGTCTGTDGALKTVTGTVAASGMQWSYESVYDGGKITLSYTAKLKDDGTLEGTIYVDPYDAQGSFTGTRKKTEA